MAGDREALGTLLSRHQDRVFRLCLRVLWDEHEALEATQETMVRVVRAIESFDERAQFTTWLTRIALNACHSRARSEKLRRHQRLDAPARRHSQTDQNPSEAVTLASNLPSREPSAAQRVEEEQARIRVLDALSRLEPEARTILILRDGQDLEYEQIADVLGVSLGTVKSRLFRARQALRQMLEPNAPTPEPTSLPPALPTPTTPPAPPSTR